MEPRTFAELVKPYKNGCAWRMISDMDGNHFIEPGCYALTGLWSGHKRALLERWVENGKVPLKVRLHPEVIHEVLMGAHCQHCGGPRFLSPEITGWVNSDGSVHSLT